MVRISQVFLVTGFVVAAVVLGGTPAFSQISDSGNTAPSNAAPAMTPPANAAPGDTPGNAPGNLHPAAPGATPFTPPFHMTFEERKARILASAHRYDEVQRNYVACVEKAAAANDLTVCGQARRQGLMAMRPTPNPAGAAAAAQGAAPTTPPASAPASPPAGTP